jgi:hypothetical protein
MPFFCYVHRRTGGVPHFEVLPDMSEASALRRARELLAERRDAERAELWCDDTLIATVAPEPA